MNVAANCFSGLPLTPAGNYAVDVVRVHLWPTDDIDGTAAPTSVLVEVDTFGGYALGEEEAIREAILFAEGFTPGSEDHLGFINWRPEGEGPAVEVVSRPSSHAGPRPGERALRSGRKVQDAIEKRARLRNRGRGLDTEAVAPIAPGHGSNEDPGDGPAPAY